MTQDFLYMESVDDFCLEQLTENVCLSINYLEIDGIDCYSFHLGESRSGANLLPLGTTTSLDEFFFVRSLYYAYALIFDSESPCFPFSFNR